MPQVKLVDPSTAPGHLLRVAQQVHTTAWSRRVTTVTGPQYAVLVAIASWPGMDQKAAGERASLDKATMAGIVDRLARDGWIERQRDPDDGRRRMLVLTPAAAARLDDLTPRAAEVQDFLLEALDRDRAARFVDSLGEVAQIGSLLSQPRAGGGPAVLEMANTPGYLLRRAQQLHAALWNERITLLTGPQYAVLSSVMRHDVATHTVIGSIASLDSSTTREVVLRLTARGWLSPVASAADRRSRPVRVTPAAAHVLAEEARPVAEVQRLLLKPLRPEARREFIADLARVARLS